MTNLDYWNQIVGEETPEDFMRNYGSADPEQCVTRFLEARGHLCGVINRSTWRETFAVEDQVQRLTARVYLLSYLEETREAWGPALEAKPPSVPRRYREKFDQDKYPPPGDANEVPAGEADVAEAADGASPEIEPDDGDTMALPVAESAGVNSDS